MVSILFFDNPRLGNAIGIMGQPLMYHFKRKTNLSTQKGTDAVWTYIVASKMCLELQLNFQIAVVTDVLC